MKRYDQSVGTKGLMRLRLRIEESFVDPDDGHGVQLEIRAGWNDSCLMVTNHLSLEELTCLHHLIGRALKGRP